MRLLPHAVIALLASGTMILCVSSCGKPASPPAASPDDPAAPGYTLQQAGRALHYIIDSKEKGGNTLKADVWVYQSGRVSVTADMTSAGGNPTALIKVRLSNLAGETLWQTDITSRFCEGETCGPEPRREIWNYEVGPSLAAKASNLWLTLDILE